MSLGFVLAGMLLAACSRTFALDPALDVSQYAHTAWKVRDGFAKGEILAMAQTPDGYIWLGTEFGLLRFDGVRAVPWQPPQDQYLPSSFVSGLLAARDGTLWIGTLKGLASWKGGKLTQYPQLNGLIVPALIEDHEGTVWAGTLGFGAAPGKLCAIHKDGVQCYGEDGTLGHGVFNLYEDSKGNLWAGVEDGLWRWRPGPAKFYPLAGNPDGIQALSESADGTLLLGWKGGIYRFAGGKTEHYSLPGVALQFKAYRILRDREGGLWIGTSGQGLLHVHQERTDLFLPSDGLSGETIGALLEGREGNIWVCTSKGLDRFRDFAVATFSVNQGLSSPFANSVLADRDGSVWLATRGLDRWRGGQITSFGKRGGRLNGLAPHALFQDGLGRIWMSTSDRAGYFENGRFISSDVPGRNVLSFVEDTGANLWVMDLFLGLIRLSPQHEIEQIPWPKLGHDVVGSALAADPLQGGLWLGFFDGGVAYLKDGRIRDTFGAADGLGKGRVSNLRFERDGTLWAATEGGLSRLKNGRIATLTSKNGLPCDTVHWSTEDDDHSVWLYAACGLVRIARPELDAWAAAVEKDKNANATVQVTVFDSFDGVRSRAAIGSVGPPAAKSLDGRLWFVTPDGVGVIDPRHLPFNKLPPPVHIEQITADRKVSWQNSSGDASSGVHLPPLVRDLEIDYTALSFVVPEKDLFRYKLEGWDRDWQSVGNRRQAFYANLSPGNYRFRVAASNNSGVWNEAGTSLDFSIAPAYYQTWWFRSLCVVALLAMLWGLYRLRLQQLQREFEAGLEGRVGERTRIARELHDTLLQSFQGLLLHLQVASNLLPARPEDAQKKLDSSIDLASEAITEGRRAVQDLRSSTKVTNDIALAVDTFGQELVGNELHENSPEFRVAVEGTPRDLHPIMRDEVCRIACEALRNAFRHAQASRIEVEIRYDPNALRVRIRDDGKGIEPKLVDGNAQGKPGHYGLSGMRERAKLIGGNLELWSNAQSGTEVELTIPAAAAYAKATTQRHPWLPRKGARVH